MRTTDGMYLTEADLREERNRRLAYLAFAVSMLLSVAICGAILFFVMVPKQSERPLGAAAGFAVGEIVEVPVKRLDVTTLLPNKPNWSEDIVFVIKQRDESFLAFLGVDPVTGCKLNWRSDAFVDDCSQVRYSISGRNVAYVTTLSGSLNGQQAEQMVELPVENRDGQLFVIDRQLRRDRR